MSSTKSQAQTKDLADLITNEAEKKTKKRGGKVAKKGAGNEENKATGSEETEIENEADLEAKEVVKKVEVVRKAKTKPAKSNKIVQHSDSESSEEEEPKKPSPKQKSKNNNDEVEAIAIIYKLESEQHTFFNTLNNTPDSIEIKKLFNSRDKDFTDEDVISFLH